MTEEEIAKRNQLEINMAEYGRENKVEFPMCGHPELYPTMWGQEKPEPARTIGICPIHDYTCPVCGFGAGCYPSCDCKSLVGEEKPHLIVDASYVLTPHGYERRTFI